MRQIQTGIFLSILFWNINNCLIGVRHCFSYMLIFNSTSPKGFYIVLELFIFTRWWLKHINGWLVLSNCCVEMKLILSMKWDSQVSKFSYTKMWKSILRCLHAIFSCAKSFGKYVKYYVDLNHHKMFTNPYFRKKM